MDEYKITYSTARSDEYCDGFADGYARAWQECWEHMRQLAQAECVKEEPTQTPTERGE